MILLVHFLEFLYNDEQKNAYSIFFFFFLPFCLFRVAPAVYGCSQARSSIAAVAAGLPQRHSNTRFEPCL